MTIEQVARVCRNFRRAGVYVHAYLMYGFPTQTVQETVDSLEVVRQLFQYDCINSGYWHRFAATVHSPVGREPKKFGIEPIESVESLKNRENLFALNDLPFRDPSGVDHAGLGEGLRMAIYNFMHGKFLDAPVHEWFEMKVPKTKVPKLLIKNALATPPRP